MSQKNDKEQSSREERGPGQKSEDENRHSPLGWESQKLP